MVGLVYVIEFVKTDLMGANTEIHFLPVDESHTHALSRDTEHLRIDGQGASVSTGSQITDQQILQLRLDL